MDNSLPARILSKLAFGLIVLALVDLVFVNYWILRNQKADQQISSQTIVSGEKQKDQGISNLFSSPSLLPSLAVSPSPEVKTVETKTVVEKQTQTIIQNAQKEIFIPIGSGSSNSDKFEDLAGTDVTVDFSKYPPIEFMVFEASIWVVGGNGKAWGQIKTVSDNNPLIQSQISSISPSGEVKTSSYLPIPTSVKTYRMMAKTDITNFAAHIENARIKITLK